MSDIKLFKAVVIPLDSLEEAKWNANEMTDQKFSELVKSIEEEGFREPIDVVPLSEGHYRIIGGHHRVKACKVLGMEEITANIHDPATFTEDMQKLKSVRYNMIRGKLSPQKFTKLFLDLSQRYADDVLADMMAFDSAETMHKAVKDISKALPKEMKDHLKGQEKKIKTVDDLSTVLNVMFQRYGETVEKSFIFFEYGGRTHLMIEMNKDTKKGIDAMVDICTEKNMNINDMIAVMFEKFGQELKQ